MTLINYLGLINDLQSHLFFLPSLPILLLSVSTGPTLTHDDADVQGSTRRPARGAVFISPPAAAAPLLLLPASEMAA